MAKARRQLMQPVTLAVAAMCVLALLVPLRADVPSEKTTPPSTAEDKAPAAGNAPAPAPSAPAPGPESENEFGDLPSYGAQLVQMVVVLLSILIGLLVLAKLLPRWLGKPPGAGRGDSIKVIDSLALEPRKRIYLVKVGEQFFLIGTSETGVHMLADKAIDPASLPAALAGRSGDGAVAGAQQSSVMRTFAAALSEKNPAPARPVEGGR